MGPNPPDDDAAASPDLLPFPFFTERLAGVACPRCSSSLALHQPDMGMPARLLGTCPGCKRWYLIDLLPDRDGGLVVGLPDREVVRGLSRSNLSGGISLMGPEAEPGPGRKPGR